MDIEYPPSSWKKKREKRKEKKNPCTYINRQKRRERKTSLSLFLYFYFIFLFCGREDFINLCCNLFFRQLWNEICFKVGVVVTG